MALLKIGIVADTQYGDKASLVDVTAMLYVHVTNMAFPRRHS